MKQRNADTMTKPKKRRWLRVLIIVLSSIAGVLLFAFIFVMLHPGFGGNVSDKDKEAYAPRTDESYFRNNDFTNGDGFKLMTGGKLFISN